jgi:hypothetical protein
MTWASNPSFLPFWKHNFGFEGSWIIQHLQKLFCKFFYHSQQPMSMKQDFQVCFKLKLNTEVDSMWKMTFDVLFLQLVQGTRNSQQKDERSLPIR